MLDDTNALKYLEEAVDSLDVQPYKPGSGRGIVICAGGLRYFPCAWVCIHMLRRAGCQLPIELWHLGPKEMTSEMRLLLEPMNVRCIDAYEVRKNAPVRILNGWEVKAFALLHSDFREIILLDADNVPLRDPECLFDTTEYHATGAIFWPDFQRLSPDRSIWRLTGVPFRDEPEFESGQIVVDKERSRRPLRLAMWFNEHSDFWYRHIHGDKETFHFAWRKLGQAYSMPSRGIHALHATMCQHDFQGARLFQHRNMAKWRIAGNQRISGFDLEEECLSFLRKLQQHWPKIAGVHIYKSDGKSADAKRLADWIIGSDWIYERIGHDKRPMSFRADGTVDQGAAELEVFWDVVEQSGKPPEMLIQSQDALTCRLRQESSGHLSGRWERFEQMPIELRRVAEKDGAHALTADYSQNGEQAFLLKFFQNLSAGYFIDIGAADGVMHSNTRALALMGWAGTLVEPVPEVFWRLEDTYSGSKNKLLINAAVCDRDGYGRMWVVKNPTSTLRPDNRNTLDPHFAELVERTANQDIYDVREVRLISATTLINRLKRKAIDFLSIDAEGLDSALVHNLLSAGLQPRLIMWEADKGNQVCEACEAFLTKQGYKRLYQNAVNQAWSLG